ncbi:hypothetical protein BH23ACT10_BH23ACT10_33950 [soil metagenome]
MTEASAATTRKLLLDENRTTLAARWRSLEERFVDDPTQAVDEADQLVEQAVDDITTALDKRRTDVRDRWADRDDATTEQLREALHHYRVLLGQLADMAAPAAWTDGAEK